MQAHGELRAQRAEAALPEAQVQTLAVAQPSSTKLRDSLVDEGGVANHVYQLSQPGTATPALSSLSVSVNN